MVTRLMTIVDIYKMICANPSCKNDILLGIAKVRSDSNANGCVSTSKDIRQKN